MSGLPGVGVGWRLWLWLWLWSDGDGPRAAAVVLASAGRRGKQEAYGGRHPEPSVQALGSAPAGAQGTLINIR